MKRGALIVIEGGERPNRTLQCKWQVERLIQQSFLPNDDLPPVVGMAFPNHSTKIGKAFSRFLRGSNESADCFLHLLSSANRWEKVAEIKASLEQGKHVVIDQYAFASVASASAKDGMSLSWCRQPDRGLPKPDLVCFLEISPEKANKCDEFGEERNGPLNTQAKIRQAYVELIDESYWRVIQTSLKSDDEVFNEISDAVDEVVNNPLVQPIPALWPLIE